MASHAAARHREALQYCPDTRPVHLKLQPSSYHRPDLGHLLCQSKPQVLRINDSHNRLVDMERVFLPFTTLCGLWAYSVSVSHSSSRAWDYDRVPAEQLAVAVAAETASASLPDSAPAATSRDAASCTAVCSSSAWAPTSCIAVPAQEHSPTFSSPQCLQHVSSQTSTPLTSL